MKHSFSFILLIIIVCSASVHTQSLRSRLSFQPVKLSGNLTVDLLSDFQIQEAPAEVSVRKSPLTAALYSAAFPGLGQAYSRDWSLSWKSIAFAGAEVSLWVMYAAYQTSANSRTREFEKYADQNWDVTRYVDWIVQYQTQLNGGSSWSSNQIIVNPGAEHPWDRIDWIKLNQCEEEIAQGASNGFTHRLPKRPEQQYYELIGKYPQYGGGWNDALGFTPSDILVNNVSANFLSYRDLRGKANNLYTVARTASYMIVANHVLSALEAAWEVSSDNRLVEAHAQLRPLVRGEGVVELVPHVEVNIRL